MEYNDVTAFLNRAKKFGSRLDLTRIQKLCDLLHNPEKKLQFVHIAGTNGKGSTSVFLANILMQAGYKTGLFTSPFIYSFNERIQLDGVPIGDARLLSVMEEVVRATDQMMQEGYEHPTEFELVTAAAFLYFKEERCDVVVLEVGLGGILDATNVIQSPLLSVITSISYDHTEYLGDTLAEIAKNKCGIIKKGCPIVSYPYQKEEALSVIFKTAKENDAPLTVCETETLHDVRISLLGNTFTYCGTEYQTGLVGEFQVYNAITAINAAEQLDKKDLIISRENIKNGLRQAKWPARFEVLHEGPIVIADGSHNADGMRAFVETARTCMDQKRILCIFGMLRDKEYARCLKLLSEITDTVIVTEVDNPRKETADNLATCAKKYFPCVLKKEENQDAVFAALDMADKDDIVIALGSLYMMKNIKDAVHAYKQQGKGDVK